MSKVFREIQIEFDGVSYTITPSNKLLRRIDSGLTPATVLSTLAQVERVGRAAAADPNSAEAMQFPFSGLAYIVAELISAGGGNIDEDDVYVGLMDDMQENEARGVFPLVEALGSIVSPPSSVVKNSPAPKAGPKAKKKKPVHRK